MKETLVTYFLSDFLHIRTMDTAIEIVSTATAAIVPAMIAVIFSPTPMFLSPTVLVTEGDTVRANSEHSSSVGEEMATEQCGSVFQSQ